MTIVRIAERLRENVARLRFADPIAYVYNPLAYAWEPHRQYLERYGEARREILLVGMNPGPWGMAQTSVPFGDVEMVKGWLEIEGIVEQPPSPHPSRPVDGFACSRHEVSGQRLWGWARETFATPHQFFARFFVVNYCPLCFFDTSGRNYTPDKLRADNRGPLFETCDNALRQTAQHHEPRYVIGIGRFAQQRAEAALQGMNMQIASLPHPSPANPIANRDWKTQAAQALRRLGIAIP